MSHSLVNPGPWTTEVLGHTVRVVDMDGTDVAVVGAVTDVEDLLNADLIAAAPDMLKACLALLNPDRLQDAIDLAREAVAKAQGGYR